jgi:hypothetical protein
MREVEAPGGHEAEAAALGCAVGLGAGVALGTGVEFDWSVTFGWTCAVPALPGAALKPMAGAEDAPPRSGSRHASSIVRRIE